MVDLNDYMDLAKHVPSYFNVWFNKIPNLSVILKLEDRGKSLSKRPLLSNEGFPLQIGNLSLGEYHEYSFNLFEKINLEAVTGKGCRNYPTEKYISYRECDMDFVYNELKSKYKIMPFWAAKSLSEVTNFT